MQGFKAAVDGICNPPILFSLIFALFFVAFLWKRVHWIWTPKACILLLTAGLAFVGFGLTDPNFHAILTKPDNVPIVGMLFLVGFFSWLSMYLGLKNDRRTAANLPPVEKLESEIKILVWPDLVYTEMLCMILWSVLLIVWSIYLKAPIEEPANPAKTPNPSKAPWYFLGLQEMLVLPVCSSRASSSSDSWHSPTSTPTRKETAISPSPSGSGKSSPSSSASWCCG